MVAQAHHPGYSQDESGWAMTQCASTSTQGVQMPGSRIQAGSVCHSVFQWGDGKQKQETPQKPKGWPACYTWWQAARDPASNKESKNDAQGCPLTITQAPRQAHIPTHPHEQTHAAETRYHKFKGRLDNLVKPYLKIKGKKRAGAIAQG